MTKQTIAVFGATGSQGGSVVRHLKDLTDFHVRALTRRPDSYDGPADEAVLVDLDDITTLSSALAGADGVFLVTNFWEPGTDEVKQASAAVQAAVDAGVSHLIWSSLPDVEQISGGTWDVPHFTNKARVDPIVRAAGFPVHTIVQMPFYMQNLIGMMGPQPMQNGSKGWTLPIDPDARAIQMGSVDEIGSLVAGAFDNPEESAGETLSMAGGTYSFADVVEAYSAAVGETLGFQQVPQDVFASFFPQAREIGQMLGYFEDHTYMGPDADSRIAKASKIAKVPFTPLDKWLASKLKQSA
ncbi:MAG: NmrA/HSCARG family protein [Gammaproteobacteria bacterium]|nr:NmrA/HSCARG family protein [Gammaproteobacteria bacterium]MDH3416294.1 NmrA/HSCARG family protein [Gammaproteobacteria bacterium]